MIVLIINEYPVLLCLEMIENVLMRLKPLSQVDFLLLINFES